MRWAPLAGLVIALAVAACGDDGATFADASIDGTTMDAAGVDDAADVDAADIDAADIDAADVDAADVDAADVDAAGVDAAGVDAAVADAPPTDAPVADAPPIDGPPADAPPIDGPPIDAMPAAPIIATFSATPAYVRSGTLAFVRWDWTYGNTPVPAPSCAIDQGVGAVTNGQQTGINLTADRVYTLTCTNASGADAETTTVHVAVPPVIAGFTATPSPIAVGSPTTITWTFGFANSPAPAPTCSIEHGIGAVVSGQTSTVTLTQGRTYRLTCSNVGGAATADATVGVDECAAGTDACDASAVCTDTPESYTCACATGYTGDGRTCSTLAACDVTPSRCHADATCTTTPSGPACVCGPGFVGDGATCERLRIAFTTSLTGTADLATWTGAGGATGLAAADAVCQSRAVAAGLPGTYVAWMSDAVSDAYCRVNGRTGKKAQSCGLASLPITAGPWVRVDGLPAAGRIDRAMTPNLALYHPIDLDEHGAVVASAARVWAATDAGGVFKPAFATTAPPCASWSSQDPGLEARTGRVGISGSGWTDSGEQACSLTAHLRCLETGAGPALPAVAAPGRRVFLTSTSGNAQMASWADASGATGIAAADAVCRARARAAGFANANGFEAWMSTPGSPATSRITWAGPWSRLDGVVVAADRTDLLDGTLRAGITQTEAGAYVFGTTTFSFESVWTGTLADGSTNQYTCNAWASGTSGSGTYGGGGYFEVTDMGWTWAFFGSCNGVRRIYCFED